jgi:hypothetical protein
MIEKTLGYRGYVEDVKRRLTKDKPLVVTEFGLSVSEKGDGRGYGGNTLEEQRDGVVALWDDVLSAGAAGGCAFMWIDGWWKSGDEARLDDGACVALSNERPWWRLELDVSSLPTGMHVLHTRMKDEGGTWSSEKRANIRITGAGDADRDPLTVRFVSLPTSWRADKALPVTVVVRDGRGAPVVGRRVSVSRFVHTAWSEYETSVLTDSDGRVTVEVPTHPNAGIISIAASAEGELPERNETGWKQGPEKRYGVYRHLELVE